ncbi:MAG: hypothetical protein RRZ38_00290 [Hafnia sp.]
MAETTPAIPVNGSPPPIQKENALAAQIRINVITDNTDLISVIISPLLLRVVQRVVRWLVVDDLARWGHDHLRVYLCIVATNLITTPDNSEAIMLGIIENNLWLIIVVKFNPIPPTLTLSHHSSPYHTAHNAHASQ